MDKWAMAEQVMEKVAAERVEQMGPQLIAEVFCKMAEEGQLGPSAKQRAMTALLGPLGAGFGAQEGRGSEAVGETYKGGLKGGLAGGGLGALGGAGVGAGIGALIAKRWGIKPGAFLDEGLAYGTGIGGGLGALGGQHIGMQKALTKMHKQPEQLTD